VDKNDGNGNLEKIFIYEKNRTIIARFGKILKEENSNYLQLFNGQTHEKNQNGDISIVNFDRTIFDLSNKFSSNVKKPKFSELSIFWLINEVKKTNIDIITKKNVLEEIHTRMFKPFYIIIFAIISCFLLYSNEEKIKKEKLRMLIFSISIFLLIFLEIILSISVENVYTKLFFYLFPIFLLFSTFLLLINFLKKESH